MVDVEVLLSAADGAPLAIAFKDDTAGHLPSPQGVLVPRPDGGCEPLAVDQAFASRGKRTLKAEPAETVPVGTVPAEGGLRTVERIQAQLEVGAQGQIG